MSRYNGGEPVLVALPAPDGVSFVSCVVDESGTAGALVRATNEALAAAAAHGACPLEAVSATLGLPAGHDGRAWLRIGFLAGVDADASPLIGTGLRVMVAVTDGELRVTVRAAADCCPAWLVSSLAGHIARAAVWLTTKGLAPLHTWPLLSDRERHLVTAAFNDTAMPVPRGLTLHGLIAAQAARTPDAPALTFRQVTLTYGQLDGRAGRVVSLLRDSLGVQAGDVVGVMLERSEHTVVALLGVMKAGAAYVPISPGHPWETVRYMLEHAGVSVLIVDSETIGAAASFPGRLLVVDMELHDGVAVAPDAEPDDTRLAYVIFTSGSTGRPKGVAVEHRAAVNTVLWRNAFYGLGPTDVNLQIPSFAFDSSVVDIFCTLSSGGHLVIPEEALRLDASRLIALSAARGVTHCIVTPSYYQLLVSAFAGGVPTLRAITVAGESTTPQLVAAHRERLPDVTLFNEYGPTENAVCSTACRLDAAEPTVPIGRPIWNVSVLIVDQRDRPCPVGVPGEILLGGAGLARGYLNQPALTEERFVPSPVAEVTGTLYRTGDRGCWRPDGQIEFLGRADGQVKVRGFRIEVEEVEQALLRHPQVRHGAILCKADPGGAPYLAGYAEVESGTTQDALLGHMRAAVPYYMVPEVLTILPSLPLNLNGKVDRGALRTRDDFATGASAVPLSPMEARLAPIWGAVLGRPQVVPDDNFFQLGGNSLRVMALNADIRTALHLDVDLLDIYAYPTLRQLAERLSELSEAHPDALRH